MSLYRLRAAEMVAGLGGACVIVSLTLPWYQSPSGNLSAWDTFGPAVVLLLLSVVAVIALLVSTVTERGTALPVAAAVWSTVFGIAGVLAAIVRVLERPEHATGVCAGAWLGLAGALVVVGGSWLSMRDERTTLYRPAAPPPRRPPGSAS